MSESILTFDQKRQFEMRYSENGVRYRIRAHIRWDDQCHNGHNTFSVTGDIHEARDGYWKDYSGGCIHDDIAKRFPDLAPYIKWHLCDSNRPMHYIANVLWFAGDRDCWGLRKDESKQICRGGDPKEACWHLVLKDETGQVVGFGDYAWFHSEHRPETKFTVSWEPRLKIGEGKERQFAFARNAAVWPEATDEQLSLPPEELTKLLEARLPALTAEFQKDVESLGFVW